MKWSSTGKGSRFGTRRRRRPSSPTCEAQPLTIFHFLGTLADCSRKARLGAPASHGFVNQRREDRCRQRHADETSGAVRVVQDRTLARYANATRTHALELFGMQPADLARLMSLYANV